MVEFPENAMPQKFAEGLFVGGKPTVSTRPQVQSGHIEESNVNSLSEMVKMMQGMRSYESAQKLIQTMDRMTAVSYTHLDVYKRQRFPLLTIRTPCPPTRTSSLCSIFRCK